MRTQRTWYQCGVVVCCAWILVAAGAAGAAQVDATWNGGTGVWSDTGAWDVGVAPDNGVGGDTYNVLIDDGNAAASTVTMDVDATIDNLTVDAADELIIGASRRLTVVDGAGAGIIDNAGIIRINAGYPQAFAYLTVSGGQVTLQGAGSVILTDHWNNAIGGSAPTDRLVNADNTIEGFGDIGSDSMGVTNQALIRAADAGVIIVDPSTAGAVNTGTMRAATAGALVLQDGTFDNTGGLIEVADASYLNLNAAAVTGGTVTVADTGEIWLYDSTFGGGTMTSTGGGVIRATGGDSTLGAPLTVNAGGRVTVDAHASLTLDTAGKVNDGVFETAGAGAVLTVAADVSGGGRWQAGGGTLQVDASGVTTTGDLDLLNAGRLVLSGTMTAANLAMDATANIDVTGTLSVAGDVTFAMTDEPKWSWSDASVLEKTGPGDWDQIEAGGEDSGPATGGFVSNFHLGTLSLTGGAKVRLVDAVDNGNRVDHGHGAAEALYAKTLAIGLGTIDLDGLHLYYLNGGAPKAFVLGDADLNGVVGLSDLSALAFSWNQGGAGWGGGDFNADGATNLTDLSTLAFNWGVGAGAASPPVPEPSALVLLFAGGALLGIRRRKAR